MILVFSRDSKERERHEEGSGDVFSYNAKNKLTKIETKGGDEINEFIYSKIMLSAILRQPIDLNKTYTDLFLINHGYVW